MRISEGVEWAAHCCVLLAVVPDGATLPAAKLAEYHGIGTPYLAKSLQALTRSGIVHSTPGRHGGYRLARSAEEISLLDIVEAIEGTEPAFRCTEIRRRGPSAVAVRAYPPVCGIASAMWQAEAAWRDTLASSSVADIARQVVEGAPPKALVKGSAWLGRELGRRSKSTLP